MNDFNNALLELERMLMSAKKRAFSSEITLPKDEVLGLLMLIKESAPREITEAQYILDNRDNILKKANDEADKIVAEANAMATKFVEESNLLQIAEEEAKKIVDEAKKFGDEIEYDAKVSIDEMLSASEASLVDALSFIRNNREELRGALIKNNK